MVIVMKVNPEAFSYKARDASRLLGVEVTVETEYGWKGQQRAKEYNVRVAGESVNLCAMTARECWTALEALMMAGKAQQCDEDLEIVGPGDCRPPMGPTGYDE